jgi:hypothetical protein
MITNQGLETYANLHPIQLLVPPEKVTLRQGTLAHGTGGRPKAHYAQVAVNPDGRLSLLVHLEPPFRSEFISVWSPCALVPKVG